MDNLLFVVLAKIKNRFSTPITKRRSCERDIEWPFCAAHMPGGPGSALDFGCGPDSSLGLLAALRGLKVTALDLVNITWPYRHPDLKFQQGDILKLNLPQEAFDLIINCSSIEHVGLKGRYGIPEEVPDGDIEVMGILRGLMKPNAIMLLTIPMGQDTILAPMHRIYGGDRLPRLLEGFAIRHQEYWLKNKDDIWQPCKKEDALSFTASGSPEQPCSFNNALGCFAIERAKE